ncbi:MAG TPA: TIGR02281 family clan AA aspartic protease [Burkholderiales bacterium]|jgi:aspartyl protease family protein|nr:TIGR02281 family clan AA aspartic protease [Burkholderiales bacterium]
MSDAPHRCDGGAVTNILAWLFVIGTMTWMFQAYTEGQFDPNRAPQVTGAGEIVLKRDRAGHFTAGGTINGHPVHFLLDTGATQVAIPAALAERLGLKRGMPIPLMTAAGPARGYATRLESVQLATLELKDAKAIITEGLDADTVLLGMNFLRQLEIVQRRDELILRPHPPETKRRP